MTLFFCHIENEKILFMLVVEATKGGPADKARIKKNDIVIAYRGKGVTGINEFRNAVAETPIGTKAKITALGMVER